MSFRLVPKSVTLNDLERRNGPYFAYFTEFGSFRACCVNVVDKAITMDNLLEFAPKLYSSFFHHKW